MHVKYILKRIFFYKKAILIISLILLVFSCQTVKTGIIKEYKGEPIYRELLSHKTISDKKIELFWTKPPGTGPWPVVIFLHGHQESPRNGGSAFLGSLGRLAQAWRAVIAAVSQPGYGNSDGPSDFCGPFSQDAIIQSINFLRKKSFIKPDKVALYGISRGAIVASMVATKDSNLAAIILISGSYDLAKAFPTGLSGLDENIRAEAGTSEKAFQDRSAIQHADKIKSAVLILHGADDDRFNPKIAEMFASSLKEHGVETELVIFPNTGHNIPLKKRGAYTGPFLKKHLENQ